METYSSSNSQEIESSQLMDTHSILDSNSMVFSTADLNSGNFQGKLVCVILKSMKTNSKHWCSNKKGSVSSCQKRFLVFKKAI